MTRYLRACRPPKLYLPVASVVVVAPSVSPALYVPLPSDRKSVVKGKRVDLGGRGIIKKKMKSSRRGPALVPRLKLPKSLLVSLKPELTVKAYSALPHVASVWAVEG